MSIENQTEILSKIIQIMHNSATPGYSEMYCYFDYIEIDTDWSVNFEFGFIKNGVLCREFLTDSTKSVHKHIYQLHQLMKSHTGGDWKRMELTVDQSAKAKTKFTY